MTAGHTLVGRLAFTAAYLAGPGRLLIQAMLLNAWEASRTALGPGVNQPKLAAQRAVLFWPELG